MGHHGGVIDGFLTGQLLVASPSLADDSFDRAVVLVVDHDEAGALGVVINRPSTIDVGAILPDWHVYSSKPAVVFDGGPVGRDSALALGALLPTRTPDTGEPLGFRQFFGQLGLVDLDAAPEEVAGDIGALRVFAGYAGWAPDQLEQEVSQGAWFVVDSLPDDPFDTQPDELWHTVLRRQPGSLSWMASYPDDPTMN